MANKQRGYIPIEIGGETYQLRYDFNALEGAQTLEVTLKPTGPQEPVSGE